MSSRAFDEDLQWTKHSAKHFTHIDSFNPDNNSIRMHYYYYTLNVTIA